MPVISARFMVKGNHFDNLNASILLKKIGSDIYTFSVELNTKIDVNEQAYSSLPRRRQNFWKLENNKNINSLKIDSLTEVMNTLARSLNRKLRILDVTAHQGYSTLSLAAKGHEITFTDFEEENINFIKQYASDIELNTVHNGGRLSEKYLVDATAFDVVLMLDSIEEMIYRFGESSFKKIIHELLKKNKVIIWEWPHNIVGSFAEFLNLDSICLDIYRISIFSAPLNNSEKSELHISSNSYIYIDKDFFDSNNFTILQSEFKITNHNNFQKKFAIKGIKFYKSGYELHDSQKISRKSIGVFSSRKNKPKKIKFSEYETKNKLKFSSEQRIFFSGFELTPEILNIAGKQILSEYLKLFYKNRSYIDEFSDVRPWNLIWNGKSLILIDQQSGNQDELPIWLVFAGVGAYIVDPLKNYFATENLIKIINNQV